MVFVALVASLCWSIVHLTYSYFWLPVLSQNMHSQMEESFTLNVVDLDLMVEDGPLIQMVLLTRTGQKTVPNVFIGGQHIGGDSDLTHMHDTGKLLRLLETVADARA